MRILIIGAGAIGQAFARHFHLGGAEVHLLVRPRQQAQAEAGLPLYPLNDKRYRTTADRLNLTIHVDQDSALQTPFDVIALAVSATALRKGDWLQRLGRDRGHAGLLGLSGSADDADLIAEHCPGADIAWAMLAIISFTAPLPGDADVEPGIAYWLVPFSKIAMSGPDAVMTPVLAALSRGGMPVKRVPNVRVDAAFASPILTQTIHALECADWSFSTLRRDPTLLPLAVTSMRESWALAETVTGQKRPFALGLIRPMALRAVLRASRWLVPFSLERFFAYHYTKVADQTVFLADEHLKSAAEHGVEMPAATELLRRIRERRAEATD
jgi:2-dehydropantoate 2-reductase